MFGSVNVSFRLWLFFLCTTRAVFYPLNSVCTVAVPKEQLKVESFRTGTDNDFKAGFLLKVDFSQSGSPVQEGYDAYFADHENSNSFSPRDFFVNGNKITVDACWPAGTANTAMQMIDRGQGAGGSKNNLLRDWIGTDGRVARVPMVLIISGLPQGTYDWQSLHHDNNDQTGIFSLTVKDATGMHKKNAIDISNGNLPPEMVTTLKAVLESDGSEIELWFEMDAYPGNSTSFFVMNGFTLSVYDSTALPGTVELIGPLNELGHVPAPVKLNWKPAEGAESYKVFLSPENPPAQVAETGTTSFSVNNLPYNTTMFWKVEAVNRNGKTESEIRSFTTKDPFIPGFAGTTELAFSKHRDFCDQPFELILSTNNPVANIIYTTDSSVPSPEYGKVYKSGIRIDSTTVIKAIAVSENSTSKTVTHSYLFPGKTAKQPKLPSGFPEFWGGSSVIAADYEMDPDVVSDPQYAADIPGAFRSVPALSLTMDVDDWFNTATGMYVGYPNSNITREKAVTAEFIFNGKGDNFSMECGLQNQGGTSIINWKVPKQSMRLLFKEMYGPGRLKYKLFPDSGIESINTLVVDGLLYSWIHPWDNLQRLTSLYFRDQLASDMQNNMGWPSFHGIYINLFINGLYWGIYDLHERPDDAFLAEYLDANREDFDIIKHNPNNVVQGSNGFYLQMLAVARAGLVTDAGFSEIQKYLDLPAFIDYMILNFYLGNFDWAHQNYYAARNRVLQTGFRFYTWDAEHVMRYSNVNYNNTGKNDKDGPTEIHQRLKENVEYRMMFADAVYKHFFNDGTLTPSRFEQSFLYRKNEIDKAIILESARWGDYLRDSTGVTYTKNDHWLPEVQKVLEKYIPQRRDIVIRQLQSGENGLFPNIMPPEFYVEQKTDGRQTVTLSNPNSLEGDIYFTTDGTDPRQKGGTVRGSLYTGGISVSQTMMIKARIKSKFDGTWSALNEKILLFDKIYGEKIVINEIMYHPENNHPEFLELLNAGQTPVNLTGFSVSGGILFDFAKDEIIHSGAGLVLTNDTALFRQTYEFSAGGQYMKQLSNEGETIILKNNFRQTIDSVTYSDTIPWPVVTEEDGYSIELIDPGYDNSLASNWKISEKLHGTPYNPGRKLETEVLIYPNPVVEIATVELLDPALAAARFVLEIYDQQGTKVKKTEAESYNRLIQLDFKDVPSGMYHIRITPDNSSRYKPFIVKVVKMP